MDQVEILKWTRHGGDLPPGDPHVLARGDQIYLKADASVIDSMRSRLELKQEQKP
jgi:hypothetical protein